jgi:ribosome-binding ATPase
MTTTSVTTYANSIIATSLCNNDDDHDPNNDTDNHNTILQAPITDDEPVPESTNDNVLFVPDEECDIQQRDEIQALQSIYENEFRLLSKTTAAATTTNSNDDTTEIIYQYPVSFMIDIYPITNSNQNNDHDNHMSETTTTIIPPISLHVTYPLTDPYSPPILSLVYSNDGTKPYESKYTIECLHTIHNTIIDEIGMPCIMTCILTAREYFDSVITTAMCDDDNNNNNNLSPVNDIADIAENKNNKNIEQVTNSDKNGDEYNDPSIKAASVDRIKFCIEQGLDIANIILSKSISYIDQLEQHDTANSGNLQQSTKNNGGSWMFTIGLVGKPSAGKSTFFNTATGFARQRQTDSNSSNTAVSSSSTKNADTSNTLSIGGAAMAAHPFTTIAPNVGYCYVPASTGSCPDDTITSSKTDDSCNKNKYCIGSTHGRDDDGRRLLPVLLKDVAGLVPGAYQGRGRGNQFLNDLCDADVLIHICDASGLSDTDGNIIHSDPLIESTTTPTNDSKIHGGNISNPLYDMAWIRNELIEWVYSNLIRKWDTIRRKGRSKLEGMFSGYGQSMAVTCNLLNVVEKYMTQLDHQRFINPYEQMDEWDTGDIYRLVSSFLGIRFPIAIALNKMDVPSSTNHIEQIVNALPIHGTHVATPLSAKREMIFVRHHIESTMSNMSPSLTDTETSKVSIPRGTWDCLQSAIQLGNPILVFPVVDHQSYAPLPGLFRYATTDPSLPSRGMIDCIKAAGGVAPSEWDDQLNQYTVPKMNGNKKKAVQTNVQLRDAIMMKPGSTIYDVFLTLKKLGALSGEYIRAEAASEMFVLPKPVTKFHIVSKSVRIIKIMTNKRNAWQST